MQRLTENKRQIIEEETRNLVSPNILFMDYSTYF